MQVPTLPLLLLSISGEQAAHAGESSAEAVVQANLDAYNARDIERFMSFFSDDIAMYTFPESAPSAAGLQAVRQLYQDLFDASPRLHSTILKRIVFDDKVIDHEHIVGRRGSSEPCELVLIYEVKNGKIFRTTALRKR